MISVLYVDDDRSLLEIGKIFLERIGEFKVELLDSAKKALDLLSTEHVDVIVSDYEMPKMNGLEFLQIVRSKFGEIPFILFTGKGREEVVILALNNGADYYLQKGGEPKSQFAELAHKIKLAVQRRNADLALEESERRYRDVVETQRDFICRFTPDGTTVFVNEAYCSYFGKKREEILGQIFKPIIPPEDRTAVRLHFESLTPDHPVGDLEHRIIMPDGSIRWHWWREHAFFDEKGNVIEYQSVGRDITEQKRAENILLTQLELGLTFQKTVGLYDLLKLCLEKAIEISELDAGGIYLVDVKSGSINLAISHNLSNELISQVANYPPDSLNARIIKKGAPIYTNYSKLGTNQDGRKNAEGLQAIAIIPIYSANELIACLNVSSHRFAEVPEYTRVALETISTQIGAAIGKNRAEEALLQSEERYRSVVNEQKEMIARFNPDGIITFTNEAYRQYFFKQLSFENIQGKNIYELMQIKNIKLVKNFLNSLTIESPSREMERNIQDKDGKNKWQLYTVQALFDKNGNRVEYQVVGRDITDKKVAEEALKEEKHRFETLGRNIPGAIYQLEVTADGKFRFPYVSKNWFELTGIPAEEAMISADSTFAAVMQEDIDELITSIRLSALMLTPWKHEFRTSFHDQITWILGNSVPEPPGPDGTILWNGVLIDITDQKIAESEYKKSENLYRAIFDNTGTATIIIDEDTTIIYANAGFARLSGYAIGDLELKKNWTEFVMKEDLRRMKKFHANRRDDPHNAPRVYEFRFIDKNGAIRFCINNVSMIPGTTWSIASILNITDRVMAEMDYRSIIENIQDAFYRTDAKGNIILASPSAAIVLGYDSVTELIGMNIAISLYYYPEERDQFLKQIEKTGSVSNIEIEVKKKDGNPITVLTSSHKYYDVNGVFQGVEGIFRDITEQRLAEDALLQANKKLNLLTNITRHDINNQLVGLLGFLLILEDSLVDSSLHEYISKATTAAERINSIIQFTKQYEEIGVNVPTWQNVRQIVELAASQLPLGSVLLKNSLPENLELFADPMFIKIMYNLIENALNYGEKITFISFLAKKRDDEMIIICEDNGAGVPVDKKERIFDRGFGQNTGLGLTLCREILLITDISINETGTFGDGARFEINIPKKGWRC